MNVELMGQLIKEGLTHYEQHLSDNRTRTVMGQTSSFLPV